MGRQINLSHDQAIETLVTDRLDGSLLLLHIRQWVEESGLEKAYNIATDKFNDNRLGRALEAIASQC